MNHQTEAQQEAASLAWAQHFAPRTEGPSEFALAVRAAQVAYVAQKVRMRMEPKDIGDIACADSIAVLVHAGNLEAAGKEFARLVALHCTEVGERAVEEL